MSLKFHQSWWRMDPKCFSTRSRSASWWFRQTGKGIQMFFSSLVSMDVRARCLCRLTMHKLCTNDNTDCTSFTKLSDESTLPRPFKSEGYIHPNQLIDPFSRALIGYSSSAVSCTIHSFAKLNGRARVMNFPAEFWPDKKNHFFVSNYSLVWHILIGDFRVVFRLCFKVSPSAKPFIWKLVLFTCKWTEICMWIKLISIWKASH